MGQRTELFVVEKVRDERTNRKKGYRTCARFYQWGIGRTMPFHILAGVLAAYQGGYNYGVHIGDICPETGAKKDDGIATVSLPWAYFVDKISCGWNNNGAIVVQIDNLHNKWHGVRQTVINVSFMLGPEDARKIGKESGERIPLKEWIKINLPYMNRATRRFFREGIACLTGLGSIEVNFKFDEEF